MIQAKKSLGQNFLISPRVAESIALAAGLSPADTALEIGPGKGMLTKELLKSGAKIVAVEKDDRAIPLLRDTFKKEIGSGKLELIHRDILDLDIRNLKLEIRNYKVVANIPYYITGEILRLFLSAGQKPSCMILMVQKEVASRILDAKESILSLSVKAYGTPSRVMNVSRGNFFPAPNVDSAVIKIDSIQNPFKDEAEEDRFFEIVKAGFAHKRKKLSSNLASVSAEERIQSAFKALAIDENARPEDLAFDVWKELARAL